MRRLIAIVAVLSIVFAPMAWAADRHEEALTGQHVSVDQDNGDSPSDIPEPCDHCCHGSSHYLALHDGDVAIPPVHRGPVQLIPLVQPATWSSDPPTPPPSN